MKKKELEILLQKIPSYDKPKFYFEQYTTPSHIAADVVYLACQSGDIQGRIVVDLGCGTGIFSIAAALVGAKKVIGVDIDEECVKIAKKEAEKFGEKIEFIVKDVRDVDFRCDTVLMNPPFGAQRSNKKADRKFLEKGFEIADVIYTLHLSKTENFLKQMIDSLNGKIVYTKKYKFPIKATFSFHNKKQKYFDVTLLKITT